MTTEIDQTAVRSSLRTVVQERIEQAGGQTEEAKDMMSLTQRLNAINDKSSCLRVQILDWTSEKLLSLSNKVLSVRNKVNSISDNIHSPCIIKLEPREKSVDELELSYNIDHKNLEVIKEILQREKVEQEKIINRSHLVMTSDDK
jgi:hypothetical protein